MTRPFVKAIVIISQLYANLAHAGGAPIVVSTRETTQVQLSGYLLARPNSVSYAEYLSQEHSSPAEKAEQLQDRFASASEAFFNQNEQTAISAFRWVLELSNEAQWRAKERQILLFSALRVWELSERPAEKSLAMELALGFGSLSEVDKTVFSPQTVQAFKAATETNRTITVPITGWMKSYEILAYEGNFISLSNKSTIQIRHSNQVGLFSFYSSSVEAFEVLTKSEQLISQQHQPRPLIATDCSTKLDQNLNLILIDENSFCGDETHLRVATKTPVKTKAAQSKPKPPPALDLEKLRPVRSRNDISVSNEVLDETRRPSKWWENKWLWIGLGAVVTSAAVYDQNQRSGSGNNRKKSVEPTSSFDR
ncbi:MAG: hypothetical protein HRT45_11135 [Bdellovibrionales bacterium]|nr:hypothetical protein [Bdellovibrionales bacterium]